MGTLSFPCGPLRLMGFLRFWRLDILAAAAQMPHTQSFPPSNQYIQHLCSTVYYYYFFLFQFRLEYLGILYVKFGINCLMMIHISLASWLVDL